MQMSAKANISPSVIDAAHDAMTTAVSSSYFVAAGFMGLAAVVAFAVLRHVQASDAPTPDHAATVPAPRGAQVGSSHA